MDYETLLTHVGHTIVCVTYGAADNVSVECEDCHEIILSLDRAPSAPGE